MKRLLLTFTTLLVFAFALTSVAQAARYDDVFFKMSTDSTGRKIDITMSDGRKANQIHKDHWYNDNISGNKNGLGVGYFHGADASALYQTKQNALDDPDNFKFTNYNVNHVGYLDIYNYAANNNVTMKDVKLTTGGFTFTDPDDKNNKYYFSNIELDMHIWDRGDQGAFFVFTQTAWELGTVTKNGHDYTLYLELKQTNTPEESGVEMMPEHLRQEALDYFGFDAGTNLFSYYVPNGENMFISWNVSGYGANVNPYATPIPGAVWLMGTGVAGLIALRRRNR